jgi:hypothetical protein
MARRRHAAGPSRPSRDCRRQPARPGNFEPGAQHPRHELGLPESYILPATPKFGSRSTRATRSPMSLTPMAGSRSRCLCAPAIRLCRAARRFIDHTESELLGPREGQELGGQLGAAHGRLECRTGELQRPFVACHAELQWGRWSSYACDAGRRAAHNWDWTAGDYAGSKWRWRRRVTPRSLRRNLRRRYRHRHAAFRGRGCALHHNIIRGYDEL